MFFGTVGQLTTSPMLKLQWKRELKISQILLKKPYKKNIYFEKSCTIAGFFFAPKNICTFNAN
jgi:hypothetical protein